MNVRVQRKAGTDQDFDRRWGGYFIPDLEFFTMQKRTPDLLCVHVNHAEFRVRAVPVGRNRVEYQAEILFAAGLERRGGDRFDVDVRFSHADQLEGLGLVLGHLAGRVAEEYLNRDAGDCAVAAGGGGGLRGIEPNRLRGQ